ncbi:MAG: RluA family pseudouridine synthase [candidate division Zixibacteria bacterium]|nr:RluA family pseudouridine synthase [candidate division Zixibacteria bacterium]
MQSFKVGPKEANLRLDKFLALELEQVLSRSAVQRLIDEGKVTVGGRVQKASYKVQAGDSIEVEIPPRPVYEITAEKLPLTIYYEDEELLVLEKPAGMVSHPAVGHWTGTLVNALLYHFGLEKTDEANFRLGLVHRLDKDTSGLLLVAKTMTAHAQMQKQLKDRTIKRQYKAVCWGHLKGKKGLIDLPLGRSISDRKKVVVTKEHSRPALTEYEVLENFDFTQLLRVALRTGRTHQIRAHLSHLGHPVFGDPEYGGREKAQAGIKGEYRQQAAQALELINRQALHAFYLSFVHPVTKEKKDFFSELPGDFQALLGYLKTLEK